MDLVAYYAARAAEYERIYDKPERQNDLARLRDLIPAYFREREVLEVACGTGYWTQSIARTARHVTAIDINRETLDIARSKAIPADRVTFDAADLYELPDQYADFGAAFAGFWWSHIPRTGTRRFVQTLNRALLPGAVVVLLDNRYVEGSSTPIAETDGDGNTFQIRKLDDGSQHRVLKNFPSEAELRSAVDGVGTAVEYIPLDYYWVFKYEVIS